MINVVSFERRSRFLVKAIANTVKYDNEDNPHYAYWALYLDDNRRKPREVDTCATSYCVSVLEAEKNRVLADGSVDKYIYHDIIQQAVRTLIKLRGDNGAWPSVVEPRCLSDSKPVYAGDVAIGDNFFALTALLDVGFLTMQFAYTNDISEELLSIDGRIQYVCQTIDWLLENRAKNDNEGWYCTNTNDSSVSVPVTIATANVLLILNRIKNAIKGKEAFLDYYSKIEDTIKTTNEFFSVNIKTDGGVGKLISSELFGSSLLHTCKMVDALILSEDPAYIDELEKAIGFIISNCLAHHEYGFRDESVDFYSEKYNLLLPSEDEITISHENYTEGVLLYTLLSILIQSNQIGSYVSKIHLDKNAITDVVNHLIVQLENMQTKEGAYNGLFKCHVSRPEGMHPVYASFEGYRAFRMYMSLDKHVLTEDGKKKIMDDIRANNPFDPDSPYLFISYSHHNDDVVLQDVQRLKKQFNCWIDFENLDGGRCEGEDDWTEKVRPVLSNSNCKGVIMYISKDAFLSNGLLKEAEWIRQNNVKFYTFLIGFSDTITPDGMAQIIYDINDDNVKTKLRRINAFSHIAQTNKDETEFSYYHRSETFSHLSHPDFYNWIRKIQLM